MKSHLFALPLVALLPACALAQSNTQPKAPPAMATMPIEPAAKALLARATETYKGASGLSLRIATTADGKVGGTSLVRYSRPDKLSVERTSGKNTMRVLLAGSDFYVVQGTSYRKSATPPVGVSQLIQSVGGASGELISAMLEGKDPIASMQGTYSAAPFQNFKSRTVALAPRVIDGDVLSGVQSTFSFGVPARDGSVRSFSNQMTAWFGGLPLTLRRVQSRYTQNGKVVTLTEKISDQQLSPDFATDAFKFNDAGLKPVSDEGSGEGEEAYYDARLKVGTSPFAFQAKGLDGKPISLNAYKGKVVLLDFWATWCGPCVASLPDIQSAYKKYHPKGLEVVGISLDEDKTELTSFIKARKMPWPQIFDGKGWAARVPGIYGVKAIPFMLLIGKDGKIASVNPRDNIDAAVKAALAAA